MAYGKRIYLDFSNRAGTVWTIEFHQEGHTDPATLYMGGAQPIRVRWGGDRWKNIIGSEITVSIVSTADLDWLRTAKSKEIKVIVKKDGTVWGTYFGLSSQHWNPLRFTRQFEFKANDNLGLLDRFDYVDGSDDPFEGFDDCIDILTKALAITGIEYEINSADNLFEIGQNSTASDDPLKQTNANQEVVMSEGLIPGSCYTMIQYILASKQLSLYQSAGRWWIFRIPKLKADDSVAYRTFDSSGVYSSNGSLTHKKTVGKGGDVYRLGGIGGGVLMALTSYQKLIIYQNYNKKKNPYLAGTFPEAEFITSTTFKHWVASVDASGWERVRYGDNFLVQNFFGENTFDSFRSISISFTVDASAKRIFKFKYAGNAGPGVINMRVEVTLIDGIDIYILRSNGSWSTDGVFKGAINASTGVPILGGPALIDGTGTEGWYYVSATSGTYDYGNPSGNSISLGVFDFLSYNGTSWEIKPSNYFELSPPYGDANKMGEFSLLCDAPPVAGSVRISFKKPTSAVAAQFVWLDDVSFDLTDGGELGVFYPDSESQTSIISADNIEILEYWMNLIDAPVTVNKEYYKGILMNNVPDPDEITALWQEDGAGDQKSLVDWLLNYPSPESAETVDRFKGRVMGDLEYHNTLVLLEADSRHFIWENVEYDIKSMIWDGSMVEVKGLLLAGKGRSQTTSKTTPSINAMVSKLAPGNEATPAEFTNYRTIKDQAVTLSGSPVRISFSYEFPVDTDWVFSRLFVESPDGFSIEATITNEDEEGFDIAVKEDGVLNCVVIKEL